MVEGACVGSTTIAAGGSATIDAYAMNIGSGVSGASTAKIYFSTDATITASDTVLATVNSGALTSAGQAGYFDHQTLPVTLAANLAPGTYYIGGIADANNQINESNEANNTYNVTKITVTAPPQPDLSEYVSVGSTTIGGGGSTTIDAYAMNIGSGVSGASTAKIYLSTDATITTSDASDPQFAGTDERRPGRLLRPSEPVGGARSQSRARDLLHWRHRRRWQSGQRSQRSQQYLQRHADYCDELSCFQPCGWPGSQRHLCV
ncbi:hypothetical protein IVB41_34315 [Bradyrhizobium sp. 44]|nr:hypothetical protein [Bradyrhizobium sp. 44]